MAVTRARIDELAHASEPKYGISTGFGALATLRFFNVELSLFAFVGVIMLIGLVKKNGIMMIDFAIELRRRHVEYSAAKAMHEACVVRFRPIMMTTMAALVGTLPIALGLGAGGEARRPLGLAVVGGLLTHEDLAWGVRREDGALRDALDAALARLRASGRLDEVLHRWAPAPH